MIGRYYIKLVLHKTEYVTYWEILLKCKKCGKLRKKRV